MSKKITRQLSCAHMDNCKIRQDNKNLCPKKCEVKEPGALIFSDGSSMTIEQYRKLNPRQPIDHSPKYSDEEKAERQAIMAEIIKYDKSAGLEFNISKGFTRDAAGNYQFSEKAAFETLGTFSTAELKHIAKSMPTMQRGKKS